MIKKITATILIILLTLSVFAGCTENKPQTENKLNIVCTVFPQYDWVKNILGSNEANVGLTLMLDSGTDLHSYQATAEDFVTLANCDLFIYIGGESDKKWVSDALKTAGDINTLNLIDSLGKMAIPEDGTDEFDEHIWLSLKNAAALCRVICDAVCKIDPEKAESYKENTENYIKELNALDAEFEKTVKAAAFNTILFADRFPFRYLCDDYNISPYAAFLGCSAETEASFETVASLSNAMDNLNLPAVAVTESSDKSLAKTVIENTKSKNQKIVVFDSMQSVTSQNITDGKTYIGSMTENLNALKDALN